MSWSTPDDLKEQVGRLWNRGELLRDTLTGNKRFPLRLTLSDPSSADITDRFDAVCRWATTLANAPYLRIECREIRHRVQGVQRLPAHAWVDSIDDVLSWLSKRREWESFGRLIAQTHSTHPNLVPWLEKRPLQALDLADDWSRLMAVVSWLQNHPRPGIYLRQVDIPGIHTKFIESQRGVLAELLDLALPPDAVDSTQTGANRFATRYGFMDKPTRIRFRVLDPEMQTIPGVDSPDITLDEESFSSLALDTRRVFITENEINFLAFPNVSQSIVIFGAGYGWNGLARSQWLHRCRIHYWGDIDTHGFAILNQLRGYFVHVESFLMDRETLHEHATVWGREEAPSHADLARLTPDECSLYDDLRDNRIRKSLRLEQEHIGFRWLSDRLQRL